MGFQFLVIKKCFMFKLTRKNESQKYTNYKKADSYFLGNLLFFRSADSN